MYQVSLRVCQVTKSFRQRGDSRISSIDRQLGSGCQEMRLLPLFTLLLPASFCGKYTEVENFFKQQQNQTVKISRFKSTVRFFRLKEKRKEHNKRR